MQYVILELEHGPCSMLYWSWSYYRSISSEAKKTGKSVGLVRESSVLPLQQPYNMVLTWMQFFLFQVVQYQDQDYRIIELHGAHREPKQSSALGSSLIKQENCSCEY